MSNCEDLFDVKVGGWYANSALCVAYKYQPNVMFIKGVVQASGIGTPHLPVFAADVDE